MSGVQRAGDLPGCGRDAPAGGRQQEALHRGRGGLHGRAPLALRRHRARAATQVLTTKPYTLADTRTHNYMIP